MVLSAAPAARGEGDGDGESAKTFDTNYQSSSGQTSATASFAYNAPLTTNLIFAMSANVGNGYKTEDDSVSRDRNVNLSIDYDPPSPWRYSVGYLNTGNLYHRPASPDYDEFMTETRSNGVNSTLNYDFTENLKTNMSLGVDDSYQKTIIVMGQVPPPSSSRNHNYGGGLDYNLTTSTTVSVDYNGGISSSEIDMARMGTWPPREPKPMLSRKKSNSVSASLGTNKDVSDAVSLSSSLNASKSVARDNILPAMDTDDLSGGASASATWNPAKAFTISNSGTVDIRRGLFLNKGQYQQQFGETIYDSHTAGFNDTVEMRVTPSDNADISVNVNYNETETKLRDDQGRLPPSTDTSNANACGLNQDGKVNSSVNLALGQDITFHLTHYLSENRRHLIVYPEKDYRARSNNLDANIGFDWTKKLRVDVATAMKLTANRYFEAAAAKTGDRDDLNVNLNTTFTYSYSRDTEMTLATDISKDSSNYVHPEYSGGDYERINRHFGTSVRRGFGKLFIPALSVDLNADDEYYPSSSSSNRIHRGWSVYPSTEFNTSDNLSLRFGFSYSNEETDAMYNPKPENWELRQYYTATASITYSIIKNFTLYVNASDSHNVNTFWSTEQNKRIVELPAESFFNVSAGLNYTF